MTAVVAGVFQARIPGTRARACDSRAFFLRLRRGGGGRAAASGHAVPEAGAAGLGLCQGRARALRRACGGERARRAPGCFSALARPRAGHFRDGVAVVGGFQPLAAGHVRPAEEIEMGVDRRTLVRAIDANGTKNPPPNRAVEQRLKEENSLDAELYRWALGRMRSTIEAWKNEGVPKKEFQKNRVPRAALKKPPSPPQVSRKRNRPSTKPRPPLAVPNTAPDTPKAPFRKPQRVIGRHRNHRRSRSRIGVLRTARR